MKIEKRAGTTHCFGCKDFTHNLRSKEVKIANKVHGEKSKCVARQPNKSRFLKQKHNNQKRIERFSD